MAAAFLAGTSLLVVYLALVSWAQGWAHAWTLLREDLWFVAPVTVGFGVQAGLFLHLRSLKAAVAAGAVVGGGSGGMGGAAMLACCAHHLSDVVPFLGISGATILLSEVKEPLGFVAIASNAFGVAYMAMRISRARIPTCEAES